MVVNSNSRLHSEISLDREPSVEVNAAPIIKVNGKDIVVGAKPRGIRDKIRVAVLR